MKKTILLFIIVIGILVIPSKKMIFRNMLYVTPIKSYSDKNDSKLQDFNNWEYVKTRLFPRGGNITPRFKGPILISLENASEQQRFLMENVVKEVDELIPNVKISLYKDYTGFTSQQVVDSVANSSVLNNLFDLYINSISITFGEKRSPNTDYIDASRSTFSDLNTSILSDSTVIKRNHPPVGIRQKIKGAILCFNFSERTNYEDQKKYITYELLRSLCYITEDLYRFDSRNSIQRLNQLQYRYNKGNGVFSNYKYSPENYEITEYDKFLLDKLYSDKFQAQFRNHLNTYYPKLYVYNFYYSNRVKLFSQYLVIILGAIIFIISLSILHERKFRFGLLNYFIPFLLINISVLALANLQNYLQLNLFPFMYIITFTFILKVMVLSSLQAVFLWLIELMFVKRLTSFVLRLLLIVVLTFSSFFIFYFSSNIFTKLYSENVLLISLIIAICRGLYIYLNDYSKSLIKQKDVELSQLKELQAVTELNSLHAQINPHFLYNALNSIASLTHINPEKTEKMALSLSDLFKYSINRKGQKMSTVKEEVMMVENYLKIEKIRFEERLSFSITVEEEILDQPIPRFILQPLVENAIKHGIAKMEHEGIVELIIKKAADKIILSVIDNGPDYPDGLTSGHGLQSVYDLLRLTYGENASMNWENLPKKKITIIINTNS